MVSRFDFADMLFEDALDPIELISLGDYAAPAMPKEHALRAAWHRLQRRLGVNDDDKNPMLQSAALVRTPLRVLDDLADPPDCAPVLQALHLHLDGWVRSGDAAPRMHLIVVPPCDRTGTIEAWARSRDLALLPAPSRMDLCELDGQAAADVLAGDGVLVIPRLERWFLRQRNGLQVVRSLLARLAASDRRCLVGCDAWAWAYLVKAADAGLTLPRPRTFEAFNAKRLRLWFAELAADGDDAATFRLARNGEDVLACDDDGEPCSNWLRLLAARSGGIPWIAWHLWRASLQVRTGDAALSDRAARAVAGDRRTVWIVDVDECRLPPSHEDRALLTLHALLIHGTLTAVEIGKVLPTTGDADVLTALVDSGHLRCDRGNYSVRPIAYPGVRRALQSAGFPMGAK